MKNRVFALAFGPITMVTSFASADTYVKLEAIWQFMTLDDGIYILCENGSRHRCYEGYMSATNDVIKLKSAADAWPNLRS